MADWNQRFYDLAFNVSTWSKDPNTKVGAVIVNDSKQVLGIGYNGFPRGINDDPELYKDRVKKHSLVVHAERNALDNSFTDVSGATMYVTLFPCNECAKGLVQKGIRRVVTPRPDPSKSYIQDEVNHQAAYFLLESAGIEIVYINTT